MADLDGWLDCLSHPSPAADDAARIDRIDRLERPQGGGRRSPARLDGYGPIPAPTARDLIRGLEKKTRAWLRRLYLDPCTARRATTPNRLSAGAADPAQAAPASPSRSPPPPATRTPRARPNCQAHPHEPTRCHGSRSTIGRSSSTSPTPHNGPRDRQDFSNPGMPGCTQGWMAIQAISRTSSRSIGGNGRGISGGRRRSRSAASFSLATATSSLSLRRISRICRWIDTSTSWLSRRTRGSWASPSACRAGAPSPRRRAWPSAPRARRSRDRCGASTPGRSTAAPPPRNRTPHHAGRSAGQRAHPRAVDRPGGDT